MEKSKSAPTQNGLPIDIIEEILARLPVKSLLKLRCVAKSWCCLIESKTFIKTHLKNSNHSWIILNTMQGLGNCSLPSLLNDPYTHDSRIDYISIDRGDINLVGCCNGLVCLLVLHSKRFILWNPATRKRRNLPDFDNKHKSGYKWIAKYGFGFDELSDDYKVLAVIFTISNDSRYHPLGKVYHATAKVYSLKSNSWQEVHNSLYDDFGAGVYASGNLSWLRHHYYNSYTCVIVSFDLNSYSTRMVELPAECPHECLYRLRVHNGCLFLLGFRPALDIWIMKEYGVKESWDKVATFPYYRDPHNDNPFALNHSFTITPNGEVLVISNSNFRIYNTKQNVFRYLSVANSFPFYESCIYTESLASIVSGA